VATVPDLGPPWEFTDPRADDAMVPYTGEDTAVVVDEAVASLVLLRAPMWLGDAGPTISVLVSLAAEVEDLLFEAVADARDQDYTWDEIAARLASTASTTRRRYAGYTRWRASICSDGD
jgi:hypothetical protein